MMFSDRIFTPFERLLRPLEVPYRRIPSDGPLRLVLHFVAYAPKSCLVVLGLSASVEIVNLTVLWGVSHLIDGISSQGLLPYLDAHRWPLAGFVALFFPILPLLIFLCNALGVHVLSVSLPTLIQWHGHKAVESQDLGFFHDQFSGQVASRIAQVAGAVKQQMAAAVRTLPIFFVQMVGSVVLLTALSWPLTLPVLVWIAMNAVIAKQAVPQFSATAKTAARARSRVVGEMTDLYSNIQTVKLFAAEDSEAGALRRVMERSMTAQFRERRIGLTADLLVISSNTLLFIAIFAVSLWGIADGFVTLGEFVAAITITQRLASNSRGFLSLGQQISEAIGTIRDAMPVMTTPPTVVDVPGAKALTVTRGEIRFDRVHFEYHDSQQVIHDLSLSVSAGEKVGLVGLSGAGKTTLVSLLLRLYDLDGGRIVIDGQDVAEVTQASLRAQIGFIAQDVSLLHRSVGDNILYGRPGATQAELEAAAHLAQADAFIADLRDSEGRTGYAAYVGDRGVKLSGGQRQRVAIARVLLKDAPILVLDEATSALDSEAEATIQEKLDLLMEGKTVIAIAHRLSTIARMDRIVVLDRGRIIEEGRPDDLLSAGGLYSRLWARQTGGYIASLDD
ncbi:ABC transporter ATP-binding protein [Rhizobium sp. AAP116]|uniref:ABC transporter ATP-binding protein n=1 Tax=Rhizobium sp. AAP116 TaxID=1523429 RepID=UPI0006B8EF31|nr:ABC transporter ATP-binding protein [Rhizobium sp. AAP116]KPF56064.1 multidrug ABC transporter ATP-binding protein [Rhizobium sp. AAP116]